MNGRKHKYINVNKRKVNNYLSANEKNVMGKLKKNLQLRLFKQIKIIHGLVRINNLKK